MKKLLTLLTGMIAGSALYAAPVLNPAEPALVTDGVFFCDDDCWGLKVGYRGNFVFDKHFHKAKGGTAVFPNRLDDFNYYSNSGVLTLNLWDRLDLYGFVGAASAFAQGEGFSNNATARNYYGQFQSKTNTNWGVGAKVVLWESCWGNCGTTYLGLDANYERLNTSRLRWASANGEDPVFGDFTNSLGTLGLGYYETQVSLGLAHRIWNMVPYIAVKWSNGGILSRNYSYTVGEDNYEITLPGAHASNHWGYAIGVTLVDACRFTVTAEARFCDETGASVAAEFKF